MYAFISFLTRFHFLFSTFVGSCWICTTGSVAYWTGRAVPNGQTLLLALQLFCLQIDFLPFDIELNCINTHAS